MAQAGDAVTGGAGDMAAGEKLEEPDHSSSNWYFPREHIEKNSPSRKDGIDLKKETYLRKSYCTFLQDLGMRLKVPQVEETPQKLCDVIFLSYEIRNKKDPTAVQRIKQKDLYEPQKELVLLGERLVLTTLGFDLNIHHPYKPLVAAIKKFKVAQNALAQVAWNFVNDGLRTSLCLQFKPHHIAAGAIFLAAKFLKVKLPSEGEKVWWQEFEVTPRQLEEVSNQMLELYEQNREAPASRASEPSASGHRNRTAEVQMGSSAQVSDKNLSADGKARGSNLRSVDEAAPSAPDPEQDPNVNETWDQRSSINRNTNIDSEAKPFAILGSESSTQEIRKLSDVSSNKNTTTEVTLSSAQVVETNSHVEAGKDSKRNTSVLSLTVKHVVEETTDCKRIEYIGSSRVVDKTMGAYTHASGGIHSAAVEGHENNHPFQQFQQKSEWVALADVNIDRVKAAIQRRKKGDLKPLLAKRELDDEEELLEMDFENGQRCVHHSSGEMSAMNSDLEAEERLEGNFEGTKGFHHRSSQVQQHYDEGPNNIDNCHWVDGEKQGRDYKDLRLDMGK